MLPSRNKDFLLFTITEDESGPGEYKNKYVIDTSGLYCILVFYSEIGRKMS